MTPAPLETAMTIDLNVLEGLAKAVGEVRAGRTDQQLVGTTEAFGAWVKASGAFAQAASPEVVLSLIAAARERDGLRELVGKLLANLDALDDYMKQPERGDYGVECAVCMNEWLEPEDRAVMEEARQALQAGEKG